MQSGEMFFLGLMIVTAVVSTLFAFVELPVVLTDRKR
jgi:hypothetical protein